MLFRSHRWWRNKWQLIIQHTALALNKSEWFVHFFFFFFSPRCYCNVLGSQNAHPLTETYISRTLFVLRVIYNKPYYRCVVRFKLNCGPSACRTVCGEPFVFFPWTVPPLIYIYIQCPPLILAPLVNMSKGGCENKSALFILFIFHSKKITKFQPIIEVKQLKVGGKSHCEINAFSSSCWTQLLAPNYCNVLFPR